ncbi:MAG: helix-turn-helix domain-containing protein [Ramlibacter sp.]
MGRLRRAMGLTKVQAAKHSGVSLRTYERAEAGDVVTPSTKRKIERALGSPF